MIFGMAACGSPSASPTSTAPDATATGGAASPTAASSRVTCDGRSPGTIWTVAGTRDWDTGGPQDAGKGDGGAAINAQLDGPYEVLLDADGNIYITDDGSHEDWNLGRVRMVDGEGTISTVVGPPTPGGVVAAGDAGSLEMYSPHGMAFDRDGLLYVVAGYVVDGEAINAGAVYRIDSTGAVETIAVAPPGFYSGPEDPVELDISNAADLYVDTEGVLYLTDPDLHRVWAIDPDGTARIFAGSGTEGHAGDGGPAIEAEFIAPGRVASDAEGNIYITDTGDEQGGYVRMVDSRGMIHTIAGGGTNDGSTVDGPATDARLLRPLGIVVAPDGSLYITEIVGHRIRRIDPEGHISTIAGIGVPTGGDVLYGDGGPATEASFEEPSGVTFGPDGNLYIADWENARIRLVCLSGS